MSVVRHRQSSEAFITLSDARTVQEARSAYAATTSSMMMEIWQWQRHLDEITNYTHVCVISSSVSMIWKVQMGLVHRHWLKFLKRSKIHSVTFIFVPSHAGGMWESWQTGLFGHHRWMMLTLLTPSESLEKKQRTLRKVTWNPIVVYLGTNQQIS